MLSVRPPVQHFGACGMGEQGVDAQGGAALGDELVRVYFWKGELAAGCRKWVQFRLRSEKEPYSGNCTGPQTLALARACHQTQVEDPVIGWAGQ